MTTGPHEPIGGGRYHEHPRGTPSPPGGGRGGDGGRGGRKDPEPPATASEVAELRRSVGELRGAIGELREGIGLLRTVVADSDVKPTEPAHDDVPRRRRRGASQSNSDPALTRAERKVKVASAAVGVLVALASALGVGLVRAWSYIQGYGDERAASAVAAEHSRVELEAQQQRINDLLANQSTVKSTSEDLGKELERARRQRKLFELRSAYLEEVQAALVKKRPIPSKSPELEAAEKMAGSDP